MVKKKEEMIFPFFSAVFRKQICGVAGYFGGCIGQLQMTGRPGF